MNLAQHVLILQNEEKVTLLKAGETTKLFLHDLQPIFITLKLEK